VVHSEQIQSTREQQRLNGLLQRSQIERVNALGALHDAKSQLRDCMLFDYYFFPVMTNHVIPHRLCCPSVRTEGTFTVGTKARRDVDAGMCLLRLDFGIR